MTFIFILIIQFWPWHLQPTNIREWKPQDFDKNNKKKTLQCNICNTFKSKNKTIVTCDRIDTYQYRLHWVEWYPVGKGSTLPLGIWCPAPPRVGNWGKGLSSPLSTGELVHWGWLAPPRSNESCWSSHWRTWAYTSQLGLKYIET